MGKLTARQIETLKESGRHSDGDNLYLSISPTGAKSWVLFYRFGSKRKEMGLGSAAPGQITLAEARKRAVKATALLLAKVDPLTEKRAVERAKVVEGKTFGSFADEYLALHLSKFKNTRHKQQWKKALTDYCAPIRSLPLQDVDTEAVLKVLRPIWQRIPESASRTRGRIEAILDAARAQGFYQGENPARWKGHLKSVLPARQRLTRGHHAAMPYDELPAFMTELRVQQGIATMALELCILTATRSGESLGALWSEIDLAKAIWTIPAARMKAGHEHRIPLCKTALAILHKLEAVKAAHNPHVFPGNRRGKPLSEMAMAMLLRRMERGSVTVHGFRSTFRDWASEQTSFPHETCEHALAHRISDKAEAAYRRGDQFGKRRKLMDAWEGFCLQQPGGKVVPMKRA